MEWLFTGFTRMIDGSPAVALAAAVLWGMLTVVVTPCNLSSIPLVVALVAGQGQASSKRSALTAGLFAMGVLTSIAALGAGAAALGRVVGQVGPAGKWVLAIMLIVLGLRLLDVVPLQWPSPFRGGVKRRGMAAAVGLGLIFGLAAAPCTLAFMAPILGVVFNVGARRLLYATALMAAYGLGYSAMIVLAGCSARLAYGYLNWSASSRTMRIARRVFGALVVLGGVGLLGLA